MARKGRLHATTWRRDACRWVDSCCQPRMSWTQFGLHCSIAWRSSNWTAARQIGKLLRKVATRVDSGQLAAPTTIGAGDVKQYLGRSRFTSEVAERTDTPGIATGLAVTGI